MTLILDHAVVYDVETLPNVFSLNAQGLFSDLDFELLLSVAEKLHDDEYDSSEKVFLTGQVANRIYLIAQGTVQLVDERGRAISELSTGDFFGDESLFNESPRGYGAVCKTDATLLTLSRSHLLSIISECPSVAVSLLQSYASSLHCRHIRGVATAP